MQVALLIDYASMSSVSTDATDANGNTAADLMSQQSSSLMNLLGSTVSEVGSIQVFCRPGQDVCQA